MAVLIDTSVFVAVERGSSSLTEFVRPEQRYALSVVTAAELLHGVHRPSGRREQDRAAFVEGLLAGFGTVPLDLTIAWAYARISAELVAAGTPVDANDLWIASTAVARGFELLALDGDFDRIPGVRRVGLPG